MGVVENVSSNHFPSQVSKDGISMLNKRVEVCFGYDENNIFKGVIVRDDHEAPFETIIRLDNGRFVRGVECQYRLVEKQERPASAKRNKVQKKSSSDEASVVRVTLQYEDFKGHVNYPVFDKVHGLDLIVSCDFSTERMESCENDCNLVFNEGTERYSAILKNANGDTLTIEKDGDGMNDLIVSIEIMKDFEYGCF